ncbi:ketosteroid isomerase-like protein [Bradyrhizobium japonicum]
MVPACPHCSGFHTDATFRRPCEFRIRQQSKRLTDLAQYFRNGETELEVLQTYASNGLIALVMIERQSAEVGGLPAQDWSLRVTEIYRKDSTDWQLVHRHADPLVRRISLQQAAILARGWAE